MLAGLGQGRQGHGVLTGGAGMWEAARASCPAAPGPGTMKPNTKSLWVGAAGKASPLLRGGNRSPQGQDMVQERLKQPP